MGMLSGPIRFGAVERQGSVRQSKRTRWRSQEESRQQCSAVFLVVGLGVAGRGVAWRGVTGRGGA